MSYDPDLPVGAPRTGQPRPHGVPPQTSEDDVRDASDQPAMEPTVVTSDIEQPSSSTPASGETVLTLPDDEPRNELEIDDDFGDLTPPELLFRQPWWKRRRKRDPVDFESHDFDRLPPTPLEKAGDAVWLVSHKVGYTITKNVRIDLRHQTTQVDEVLVGSSGRKRKITVTNRGGGSAKTPVISVMAVADAVATNDNIMAADCNQNSGHQADLLGVPIQNPEESTAGKTRLQLGTSPFHVLYEHMSDRRRPEQYVDYDWLSRMLCSTRDGVAVVASDTAKNRTFTNVGCAATYEQFSVNYDRVYRDTGNDPSRATSLMAIHDTDQLVMPCIADIRKSISDLIKTQKYLRGRGYDKLVNKALVVVVGGKEKNRQTYAKLFGKEEHPEHIFFIDKCRHLARYEPIKWNRLPYKVQLQIKQLVAAAIGQPLPKDLVDYKPDTSLTASSDKGKSIPDEETSEGDAPAAPAEGVVT